MMLSALPFPIISPLPSLILGISVSYPVSPFFSVVEDLGKFHSACTPLKHFPLPSEAYRGILSLIAYTAIFET